MATKKPASSAKKSTSKKPLTTKVTTVKAVTAKKPTRTLSGFKLNRTPNIGAAGAEFIGTFLLAASIIALQGQPLFVLFAVAGITLAVGGLSGAHLNPAITIATWLTRKISGVRALIYAVAQVLGAMLALVVLNAFVSAAPAPTGDAAMYGQSAVSLFKAAAIPEANQWVVLFAEVLGATIFGFAFASARRHIDSVAKALTVGAGLYLGLLIAGSAAAAVSATAILNPAVAVALQAINFESVWPFAIYLFAATLGATIGFFLNDLLNADDTVSK